jgi:hypothetical protein
VEGIQVHANEGGVTQTRGGVYWIILPAGCNMLFSLKISFLIASILIVQYAILHGHLYEAIIGQETKCWSDKYASTHLSPPLPPSIIENLTLSTLYSNVDFFTCLNSA